MRSDRYTKVVLTVIAVALCVIALPRLEAPEVMAASGTPIAPLAEDPQQGMVSQVWAAEDTVSETQERVLPASQATETTSGPAPLPLRWRLDIAAEEAVGSTPNDKTFCSTTVVVRNLTSTDINAQVEWFAYSSGSLGYSSMSVPGDTTRTLSTDFDVVPLPFFSSGTFSDLDDFSGWANVHADDPRVYVSAYVVCRDGLGYWASIVGMTRVGTVPVGATAQYFMAGMPATWTPPLAEPELPE